MTKPPLAIKRRLAAIFCADAASYARLMSVDEASTLFLLNEHREVMARQIAQHAGRIANTAGDSIVAEFSSAVDAVRCAIDVQERIAAVNEDVPEGRRVVFRIGVHVGEVFVREGDIFGDGVNISARMEKIAPPGRICLSGVAQEYVKRVLPLTFDELGPQTVKNLSTPICAYLIHSADRSLSRALPPVHRNNEFNLGRRFHRVLTTALTEITNPEHLTPVEPSVFASLHDAPMISERRLAMRIGLDVARVQRMIRHLELRGFVYHEQRSKGRPNLYGLTQAGLELYERLHPTILAVRDRVLSPLSETERETLRELLARVICANEFREAEHSVHKHSGSVRARSQLGCSEK